MAGSRVVRVAAKGAVLATAESPRSPSPVSRTDRKPPTIGWLMISAMPPIAPLPSSGCFQMRTR